MVVNRLNAALPQKAHWREKGGEIPSFEIISLSCCYALPLKAQSYQGERCLGNKKMREAVSKDGALFQNCWVQKMGLCVEILRCLWRPPKRRPDYTSLPYLPPSWISHTYNCQEGRQVGARERLHCWEISTKFCACSIGN